MATKFICGASCNITTVLTGPGETSHCYALTGAARVRVSDADFGSGFAWEQTNAAAGNSYSEYLLSGTRRAGVMRVKTSATYSGTREFLQITTAAAVTARIRAQNDVIEALVTGGTTRVSSFTITPGTDFVLEWQYDVSSATTLSWRINGVAQTDATGTAGATTLSRLRIGTANGPAVALTTYWGDLWVTDGVSPTTHPLGEVNVKAYRPNADGTHSFTVGDFKDAGGTNIAVAATNVNTFLEEDPMTVTERVAQAVIRTTGYVEVDFEPSNESNAPIAVGLTVGLSAATTAACTQQAKLNDGGTTSDAYTLQTVGVATPSVVGFHGAWDTRPNGGGVWTDTAFDALKVRWGYSGDVTPNPYLAGMVLEVAFPIAAGGNNFTSSPSGSLSFSGALAKQVSKPTTGGLTFAGSTFKLTSKPQTGALSFAGSVAKQDRKTFPGGLSFSGSLAASRIFGKALTAGLTFVGGIAKTPGKALSGSLSFVGSQSRITGKLQTAGLTFTGAISKRTSRSLTGGLTFLGSLARAFPRTFTAGLTFSGSVAKRTGKSVSGGLTFAGSLARTTGKALAGGLTFTGSLARAVVKVVLLQGALTFAGAISKRTGKLNTAALTFVGSQTKAISRTLTGGLTFAGMTAKSAQKTLAGSLTFVGSQTRRIGKALSAGLSFSGTITRRISRSFQAAISFIGNVTGNKVGGPQLYTITLTAALSFSGALSRTAAYLRTLTATLGFTGGLTKRTSRVLSASVTFTGAISRRIVKNFAADLSFVGQLPRRISRLLQGGLSFSGSLDAFIKGVSGIIGVISGRGRSASARGRGDESGPRGENGGTGPIGRGRSSGPRSR